MTILLVRHGSAGDPYRWLGDDVDRPLDASGVVQASRLNAAVAELSRPVTQVMSSRAVRCLQTVGPLCDQHGVEPEAVDTLFEGATDMTTLLVRDLAVTDGNGSVTVLCSHSDVILDVIRDLVADGAGLSGGRGCGYASIWELTATNGRVVHAHYRATP